MKFCKHLLAVMAAIGVLAPTAALAGSHEEPSYQKAWLDEVQSELSTREYQASIQSGRLQAPNREQGFRAHFDSKGVRLSDRLGERPEALVAFRLSALGRHDDLVTVDEGEVRHQGSRVEISRPGVLEWYENRPEGLEQGFTLTERPEGDGDLQLELALQGARARQSGEDIELITHGGQRLRYSKLKVIDADGRDIPARMFAQGDQLALVVSDTSASYPLVVDPLISRVGDTVITDPQYAGGTIANAGDVNGDGFSDMIIGSAGYDGGQAGEGAVFVFHGSANGLSTTPAVTIESNIAGAGMGNAVSSAGDVNGDGFSDIVVGASSFGSAPGEEMEGAVFVFLGSASGVQPASSMRLESNQGGAQLGRAVASAGDMNGDGYADIVVGAPYFEDDANSGEGGVFVYYGGATGIVLPPVIATSDHVNAYLGFSVSGAGDVNGDGYADLVAGALNYDNGADGTGAAFLIYGGASGAMIGTPSILPSHMPANSSFGYSVAGVGDFNGDGYSDVIVGAPAFSGGSGAVQVYKGGPAGISGGYGRNTQALGNSANYGSSVSAAGDVNGDGYADAIIGAPFAGGLNQGAVVVLLGSVEGLGASDDNMPEDANIYVSGGQEDGEFGIAVAGGGDVDGDGYADIIISEADHDGSGNGETTVFHGGAYGVFATARQQINATQPNAEFGISVASAGDVNGDGYDDVVIGASQFDAGEADEGAAFIYHGSSTGISATPAVQLEENDPGAEFGWDVSGAGDVNADGYADVIIGAREYNFPTPNEGAAFIYHGSNEGVDADYDTILEANQTTAYMGYRVAGAGDVNGDGYSDVIVSAVGYDGPEVDEGVAFVFQGGPLGIDPSSELKLEIDQAGAQFGSDVAGAGDINGDGYGDVIVGCGKCSFGESEEGAVFVYHGSSVGLSSTYAARMESNQAIARLGNSIAAAGDVNGDGFADIIAGAANYDDGQSNEGGAFVYLGSAAGVAISPATTLQSNQGGASLGSDVAGAGDINGDGYADIIVGANLFDLMPASNDGAVFVYHGSAMGIPETYSEILEGTESLGRFGDAVAGAGDVNGDGFADVIVGARFHGASDEGAAFIFHGNTDGRLVQAAQSRAGEFVIPVPAWTLSYSENAFWVSMQATSPRGRELVKLEVEACPPGQPFGGSCTTAISPSWTDLGASASGEPLTLPVTGLTPSTLYHWRARALYAASSATQSGITISANPTHGPWRRLSANAGLADIRVREALGVLTITPNPVDFGDVLVGEQAELFVTLANEGSDALAISTLDAPSAPFAMGIAGTCSTELPLVLGAGESCTISYVFTPTDTGAALNELRVIANAMGSDWLDLTGNGVQGNLVVSPTMVEFGEQVVGTTSAEQTVTLSNTGSAAVTISALGSVSAPFQATANGSCGTVPFEIAAGASCTLTFTFSPMSEGLFNQSVPMTHDATGATSFSLNGFGLLQGLLNISPSVLDFGAVDIGVTTAPQFVTLSNTGSGPATISGLDAATSPFIATADGSCGQTLPITIASGESCTLAYQFAPSTLGDANQVIDLEVDVPGDSSFQLSGQGRQGLPGGGIFKDGFEDVVVITN